MSESETKSEKKYDVAISFLHKDETLAVAIDARLREHFNVFIYSKRQEELAGTNGLESLREAFLTESRLVVVLYREAWGTTQWTRVEQQAITDRFLKDGWDFLLFVMLNDSDHPPKWLPQSEIRLRFQEYGFEELIAAVKIRAQKLGSIVRSETALDRAKRFEDASRARADREKLLNSEGSQAMRQQWDSFIASLSAKTSEANQNLSFKIVFGNGPYGHVVRAKNVSLSLTADPAHPTTNSRIIVQEWKGALNLTTDGSFSPFRQPKRIAENSFYFDYQPAYGWCWHSAASTDYYNAAGLAEEVLMRLLNLQDRFERGEIKWSDSE
jgi:hypothetical protein